MSTSETANASDNTEGSTANVESTSGVGGDSAWEIVKNHALMAMAAGVIPVPLVDVAAITAIQLRMLKKLSDVYGVEFRKDLAKNLLWSLLGGTTATVAGLTVGTVLKAVPVVGPVSGLAGAVSMAGLLTYAVGKTFSRHFENGGNFLDFRVDKMRDVFNSEIEKGKEFVSKHRNRNREANQQGEDFAELKRKVDAISEKLDALKQTR